MLYYLKRLLPGIGLIVLAALVLLIADHAQRSATRAEAPKIAIFQFSSRPVLDDCVAGAVDGLRASGIVPDRDVKIQFYNAENDLATANSMARAILQDGNRLVITFSTPCLQVMANVNKDGKIVHLFGAVTDPFAAGVGISRKGRPAHLAGLGTFQPVRETFQMAKRLNPALRTVGVVWNPGDAASEACLQLARDESRKLGVTLREAQVEASSGVAEAAASLTARGVQALWVGGDNTVEMAVESLVKAARQAGIPLFCNAPTHLQAGAFVALGADYREVGRLTGDLAARVIKGLDPASVPVENVVPRQLAINLAALKGMREKWTPDSATLAEAAILIDAEGKSVRSPASAQPAQPKPAPAQARVQAAAPTLVPAAAPKATPPAKLWKIQLLDYTDSINVEETHAGLFAEFKARGLVEGRDYELKRHSAHGDMAVLNGIVDAAVNAKPDLIITTSTPTLQLAVGKVKRIPVVFTTVADGVQAGAGESSTKHLPNITGSTVMSDFDGMIRVVQEYFPQVRRVGTLFVPSEINSVRYKDELEKAAVRHGLALEAVGVATTAEVADAAMALTSKGVGVVTQISDNITGSAVPAIAEACRKARVPLFGFVSGTIKAGAAVVVARDYQEGGRDAARIVARVMKGEHPAGIPFVPLSRTMILVNPRNAELFGMKVPEALLKRADKVVN
ncbi:MAG: ABC transporter substrate-binding protein [Deltaproteobacteria bacterium]|nr:ABC transporter substrate-binding protein [Deltaproteobacteria bacterium]